MWRYNNQTDFKIPTGAVGFVYEIRRTNLLDDIFSPYLYIGKKQLFGKGKLNKGTESNWRDYWGSSTYLEDDINKYGKQNFERHIIMFCYSYSELNWEELRLQIELGTLTQNEFSPMPKKYYNYNVINKLYTDRYFDAEDADRLESYLLLDNMRDYPLYLTNGEVSIRVRNGLYDLPKCIHEYPNYRIGSSPDTIMLDMDLNIPGGYAYESDYSTKGTHTLTEAFKGYKFINNGSYQNLVPETIDKIGYEDGHLILEEVEYENIIIAINTKTFEVENVPESLFESGNYVKVGTKPIEVKVGKEIIFKGFAKDFVKETPFEIKETWINRVLKKARTNTWQKLSPTFTKKAKEINPDEILVKKVNKIK